MFEAFFSLFIWPIEALIQVFFIFFMKVFSGNPGLTIVVISLVVNTLLLPIYLVADRWQGEERNLLDRMRAKVASIRAVFRGDERQMILNTYYRQMGYHPLFSIRSSVGLLIQIPFFIAAYDFLSHSPALAGVKFLFLQDLSRPDALVTIGGLSINLLPFVMTAVNLCSAFLYTKGLRTKDKVQLFLLAAVFLVLLYGSPSGLVLYWTVSNLFSLGKNASMALKRPGRAFHVFVVAGFALATMVPASGLMGAVSLKMLVVGGALSVVLVVLPFAWHWLLNWASRRQSLTVVKGDFVLMVLAAATMTLLTGLVIPSLLIGSSPAEFDHAWAWMGQTALQSISLFFVVPLAAWALANPQLKRLLVPGALFVVLWSLINCFAFPSGGLLSESFLFGSTGDLRSPWDGLTTVVALVVAAGLVIAVWKIGHRELVRGLLSVAVVALAVTGAVTLVGVQRGLPAASKAQNTTVKPVFHLSQTKPNLFVVFLDRAAGVTLPGALAKAPELKDELAGFVYYPNTLSFAHNTILGSPALFGGYEYTPDAMNARDTVPAVQKENEALTLLPKVFGEAGYRVTFTDPAFADFESTPPGLKPFQGMTNVTALNIKGDNYALLLKELRLDQDQLPPNQRFEYDILERFSLFRIAPPLLRYPIYRNGEWWNANKTDISFGVIMNSYANLYYLRQLTVVDSDQPTLNIIENETTHDTGAFGPDLTPTPWHIGVPPEDLALFGDEESALYTYNYAASLRALVVWFHQLKAQGVWDNTKIIVVADHGVTVHSDAIKDSSFARFNPLLMVKDFGDGKPFRTDPQFMTNADVPALLGESLGGIKNPWSGKPIDQSGKKGRLLVHFGPSGAPDANATQFGSFKTWELTEPSVFTKDGWVQR